MLGGPARTPPLSPGLLQLPVTKATPGPLLTQEQKPDTTNSPGSLALHSHRGDCPLPGHTSSCPCGVLHHDLSAQVSCLQILH